jgi:hypothetical protein
VELAGQGGGGLVDEGGEGEIAPTGRRGACRPELAGARRTFPVAWQGGTETGVFTMGTDVFSLTNYI